MGMAKIHIRAIPKGQKTCYIDVGATMRARHARKNRPDALLTEDTGKVRGKGSGIGLKNVQERIQLYFGADYGLSLYSEPDEGTTARIPFAGHLKSGPFGWTAEEPARCRRQSPKVRGTRSSRQGRVFNTCRKDCGKKHPGVRPCWRFFMSKTKKYSRGRNCFFIVGRLPGDGCPGDSVWSPKQDETIQISFIARGKKDRKAGAPLNRGLNRRQTT